MRRRILLAAAALVAALAWVVLAPPRGPRSIRAFDPDRTADREVDMWQAYYEKRNVRLFTDLVRMLHDENHYSWAKASQAAFYLARAAARFAGPDPPLAAVQADLVTAYDIERRWLDASFSPEQVATLELAWWTARRVPGQDHPDHVGDLIALENAALYGVPRERVLEASRLRAWAGKLRDEGGVNANWNAVRAMLRQSYRSLKAAVGQ